jgi:hypothetical protein
VVALLLNRRVFEGVFDDAGATFDGRSVIFKERWLSGEVRLAGHGGGR